METTPGTPATNSEPTQKILTYDGEEMEVSMQTFPALDLRKMVDDDTQHRYRCTRPELTAAAFRWLEEFRQIKAHAGIADGAIFGEGWRDVNKAHPNWDGGFFYQIPLEDVWDYASAAAFLGCNDAAAFIGEKAAVAMAKCPTQDVYTMFRTKRKHRSTAGGSW